jgi:hypothetical protein
MRMEESASAEAQKPDRPKNPNRHSLLARLRAVGIEDAVMAALEAGQTLRAVHDIITARGIDTTLPAIHDLKTRHLAAWVSRRVMADARQEGVDAETLPEAVRLLLLAKVGRVAVEATGADQIKTAVAVWAEWMRAAVADRADARAEWESRRKVAMKIEELLANEDKLAAVRDAHATAAAYGTEARLKAIVLSLWGNFGEEAA